MIGFAGGLGLDRLGLGILLGSGCGFGGIGVTGCLRVVGGGAGVVGGAGGVLIL